MTMIINEQRRNLNDFARLHCMNKRDVQNNKRDIRWFQENRPEIFEFVKNVVNKLTISKEKKNAIVHAPVKCGKREIKECISIWITSSPETEHYYLCSLNRKDDKPQIEELKNYGFKPYVLKTRDDAREFFKSVTSDINQGKRVIIHINESDYGTGMKQNLNEAFNKEELHQYNNLHFILYSATNEESENSVFAHDCLQFSYEPPVNVYRGAQWFIKNNLIHDAGPFWNFLTDELTKQGKECLDLLKNDDTKAFGVVRLVDKDSETGSNFKLAKTNKSKFEQEIRENYGFNVKFIDQENSFSWFDGWLQFADDWLYHNKKTIFVICQTCTRSTEIGFHKLLSFWHDYRRGDTSYQTSVQAEQRVIHYHDGHSENLIHVFGYKDAWELSAKIISKEEFEKRGGNFGPRIDNGNTLLAKRENYAVVFITEEKYKEKISPDKRTKLVKKYLLEKIKDGQLIAQKIVNNSIVPDEQKISNEMIKRIEKLGTKWENGGVKITTIHCSKTSSWNVASDAIKGNARSIKWKRGQKAIQVYHLDNECNEYTCTDDEGNPSKEYQRWVIKRGLTTQYRESWEYVKKLGLDGAFVAILPLNDINTEVSESQGGMIVTNDRSIYSRPIQVIPICPPAHPPIEVLNTGA